MGKNVHSDVPRLGHCLALIALPFLAACEVELAPITDADTDAGSDATTQDVVGDTRADTADAGDTGAPDGTDLDEDAPTEDLPGDAPIEDTPVDAPMDVVDAPIGDTAADTSTDAPETTPDTAADPDTTDTVVADIPVAGSNATADIVQVTFEPGQTLTLVVVDEDESADPDGSPETDDVIVEVAGGADVEMVTLDEGGAGTFEGTLATEADGTPTASNGMLEVTVGTVVTLTYVDPLRSDGSTAGVNVTDTALAATGVTANVTIAPDDFNAGESLTITVTDDDVVSNANPGLTDSVTVSITGGSDAETATLPETSDGQFSGEIMTEFADAALVGDGIVQVLGLGSITVTFDDPFGENGIEVLTSDTTNVLAGVDAILLLSVFCPNGVSGIPVVVQDNDAAAAAGDVVVTVTVDPGGDQEDFTLGDDGGGQYSLLMPPASGESGVTLDNGTLEVRPAEVLTVTYSDPHRANGDTRGVDRVQQTTIEGDNGSVTIVNGGPLEPGDKLFVQVVDRDVLANPTIGAGNDSVTVVAEGDILGDSVTFSTLEAGFVEGNFVGELNTEAATSADPDDDLLQLSASAMEEITVTYTDELDESCTEDLTDVIDWDPNP